MKFIFIIVIFSSCAGASVTWMALNRFSLLNVMKDHKVRVAGVDRVKSNGVSTSSKIPEEISEEIKVLWGSFIQDFDGMVMGKGLTRVILEDGSPCWKRGYITMDLTHAVHGALQLETWKKLVKKVRSGGSSYALYFNEIALSGRQDWMAKELSELDLLPFILLEVFEGSAEEVMMDYLGLSIYSDRAKKEIRSRLLRYGIDLEIKWGGH